MSAERHVHTCTKVCLADAVPICATLGPFPTRLRLEQARNLAMTSHCTTCHHATRSKFSARCIGSISLHRKPVKRSVPGPLQEAIISAGYSSTNLFAAYAETHATLRSQLESDFDLCPTAE
eukprot:6370325-Amphidinium_carterae.1